MESQKRPTVEERFAEFGARIDSLLNKAEHSEFISGVKSELGVWRRWIDEVKVQSELGSMEARDRVDAGIATLTRRYSALKKQVGDLEEQLDPASGLQEAVRKELLEAKDEIMSPETWRD